MAHHLDEALQLGKQLLHMAVAEEMAGRRQYAVTLTETLTLLVLAGQLVVFWQQRKLMAQKLKVSAEAEERAQRHDRLSGEPQEAVLTIADRRRRVADGILGDIPKNRRIGDEMNARHREMYGQPKLLHGQ